MTAMLTITLSGTSSVLQNYFLPEIMLDDDCEYTCALLDLIIKNNSADSNKMPKLDDEILCINCDIISGSYINGQQRHVIHQFATNASYVKDSILAEIPKNLNYFPIKINKKLGSIQISIVNQEGKLVNIPPDSEIFCRIIIKRVERLSKC